ncbi:MAG TPA: hypothetical protein ENJ30_03455, partial [Desulfobulbaceae bacterium]|nr:hypothetical protein [Desulfobulbaceae bacterium]
MVYAEEVTLLSHLVEGRFKMYQRDRVEFRVIGQDGQASRTVAHDELTIDVTEAVFAGNGVVYGGMLANRCGGQDKS